MNAKSLLRTAVFLALLFVMVYTGMYNTHTIKFQFPILSAKDITQPAALIFFTIFAVGVIAGTMLGNGGGSSGKSSGSSKK